MEILSIININIDVDFSLTWHDISKGLLKIEVKLIKFGALNTQKAIVDGPEVFPRTCNFKNRSAILL